jgi:hypothetical protein
VRRRCRPGKLDQIRPIGPFKVEEGSTLHKLIEKPVSKQ